MCVSVKTVDYPANLVFVKMLVVVFLVSIMIISSVVLSKHPKIVPKNRYDRERKRENPKVSV